MLVVSVCGEWSVTISIYDPASNARSNETLSRKWDRLIQDRAAPVTLLHIIL